MFDLVRKSRGRMRVARRRGASISPIPQQMSRAAPVGQECDSCGEKGVPMKVNELIAGVFCSTACMSVRIRERAKGAAREQ